MLVDWFDVMCSTAGLVKSNWIQGSCGVKSDLHCPIRLTLWYVAERMDKDGASYQ